MDSMKLTQDVCRICLEDREKINWNNKVKEFCGLSYKDCYYKYLRLVETDSDCFPTTLCGRCAIELKNAHFLFEMALESFNILQGIFKVKENEVVNSLSKTINSDEIIYECFDESSFTDEVICYSPAYETMQETDSGNNNFIDNEMNQFLIKENVEPINSPPKQHSTRSFKFDNFKSLELLLDLNLTLEIHGAKSLRPSANKSTKQSKLSKSLHHTPKKKLSKSSYGTNLNGDKMSELIAPAQSKNTCREKSIKFLKSAINEEKAPELSATYTSNNETNPCTSSDIIDNRIKEIPSEQSQKSLLKELFGKDVDINALCERKNKKPRELMCQYCSLKVNGSHHLRMHEATHLKNRKRNIICPKCGIKFYTKDALNEHKKIHDENRKRKHKCEYCEKAFYHSGALNVHKRVHLGLMVKCQLCPKQFYRQIDLNRHLPSHSATGLQNTDMIVKKKKYKIQCQYCNKAVLTTKWKEHKAAHLNQPQVKCKICDKNFFSRHSCSSHIRKTHRKERSEIEENIHYYVDCSRRMSHLMMKHQESLLTFVE